MLFLDSQFSIDSNKSFSHKQTPLFGKISQKKTVKEQINDSQMNYTEDNGVYTIITSWKGSSKKNPFQTKINRMTCLFWMFPMFFQKEEPKLNVTIGFFSGQTNQETLVYRSIFPSEYFMNHSRVKKILFLLYCGSSLLKLKQYRDAMMICLLFNFVFAVCKKMKNYYQSSIWYLISSQILSYVQSFENSRLSVSFLKIVSEKDFAKKTLWSVVFLSFFTNQSLVLLNLLSLSLGLNWLYQAYPNNTEQEKIFLKNLLKKFNLSKFIKTKFNFLTLLTFINKKTLNFSLNAFIISLLSQVTFYFYFKNFLENILLKNSVPVESESVC